jgi:aminopeptidase N
VFIEEPSEMSGRVLLPNSVVPEHYSLELTPDLEGLTFQCDEEISVEVRNSVNEITLHLKDIHIISVNFTSSIDGKVFQVNEINYNKKLNTVKFVFDENLSVGNGSVKIKYSGILNGEMVGFYKSTYSDVNGTKKIMASTQFEALDARRLV